MMGRPRRFTRRPPCFPTLATITAALLLIPGTVASGTPESDPAAIFRQAVSAAERGELNEAVALMEKLRAAEPDHPNVLWNLGIWLVELEHHDRAIPVWNRYRQVEPDDWRARAKLVQAYQAAGRLDLRDKERSHLLEWYAKAPEAARPDPALFCRDQFRVDGTRVFAFEYFEPSGERMVYYRFSVLDAGGEERFWYSLGSYETTTVIARELGEIGENDRLYHLDRYERSMHETLAFFQFKPTYEDIKDGVVAALKGDLEPISSTEGSRSAPD